MTRAAAPSGPALGAGLVSLVALAASAAITTTNAALGDGPLTALLNAAIALLAAGAIIRLGYAHNEADRRAWWRDLLARHAAITAADPDWRPDWRRRGAVGVAIALVVAALCAVVTTLVVASPAQRGFALALAALLAAAGALDLWIYRLPLVITLPGLALAVIVAVITLPAAVIGVALGWAALMCVAHAVASRASMQLGDYLATFWIALASPFAGLLAIVAGQLALSGVAWVNRWQGKPVPVGGAWLLAAALLLPLPVPSIAFLSPQQVQVQVPISVESPHVDLSARAVAYTALAEVGNQVAAVAFFASPQDRRRAATDAARAVASVRHFLRGVSGVDPSIVAALEDLERALNSYDIDGVRALSAEIAGARAAIRRQLDTQQGDQP